jgi:undecaprenyl-diphosphatase
MNEYFVAIIVGITQGITEFLPISSTAHNLLISHFLGKSIDLKVSNTIQFGTLLAIVQYFWSDLRSYFKRIIQIIKNPVELRFFLANIKKWWLTSSDSKSNRFVNSNSIDVTIFQLVLATIPISIVGLLFRKNLEIFKTNFWIGVFLIVGASLLFVADRFYHNSNPTKTNKLTKSQTMIIGFFQAMAVFPGMSRSGSCLAGSYFLGIQKEAAIRFAFLLSVPALGLAGIVDAVSLFKNPSSDMSLPAIILGTLFAYLVGHMSLKWLLGYLAKNNFNLFIVYRIILGLALILWLK